MADNDSVIHTEGLTKFYGKQRGILDISLDIERGEVFGYLGPNGAGKTTTIRTLLHFIFPTRGRASIFGLDIGQKSLETRRRIGYLPGELNVYDNLTGAELLEFLSHLRGGVDWQYVRELATRLDYDLAQRIKTLSHGNRQKVGLIQAFMNKPELLILDEPTIGLDPLMQQEFYQMLDEVRQAGRTVFLSSHILPEVERTADRIGIVRNSRLVTVQTVDDLKARARRRFQIVFAEQISPAEFAELPGVQSAMSSHDGYGVDILIEGPVDGLLGKAAEHRMENVISHEGDLEEAFLAFYVEDDAA